MRALLLATFLALPLPAVAETREERIAAARDYIAIVLEGFDEVRFVESLYQPILDQVAATGETLTDEQLAAIRDLYFQAFANPLDLLMTDQAEIMADIMTLAEIQAIVAFYSTAEGRSVMAKLPQLNAAQQQKMSETIGRHADALTPQVLAIINEEAPPAEPAEPTAQP